MIAMQSLCNFFETKYMKDKMKLSAIEIDKLTTSLHYCTVEELKEIGNQLNITLSGKKANLIAGIVNFITTGKQLLQEKIPAVSCKRPGKQYPLTPDTFIVYGAFKNNLATRIFLKKLIGDHFHFTAFGQDWIRQRWINSNPPTYAEFADFWQSEYAKRKGKQLLQKPEWAYLNFLKKYKDKNPHLPRELVIAAWQGYRLRHKKNALALIKKYSSK